MNLLTWGKHLMPAPQTLKLMKLTFILLTAAFLQVSAKGVSQTITFSGKGISLEKVFKEIKKQSGYVVFYNYDLLKDAKAVTINVKNANVQEVLKQCFSGQPLTYTIENRTIVITKKQTETNFAELILQTFSPPPIDVHGRVVNEKGEPASGVTVTVKGTRNATATDINGEFIIKGIDENATLVFTSTDMETLDIKVNGKTALVINLKTKVTELGDVAVTINTGYQQLPKERATGSFVLIDNKTFNEQVSTDILSRLEAIAGGVNFNRTTLNANGLTIRGVSSILGSNAPLIIVDNFPYEGDINNINPNSVESITILKDAAAASIWGARAGNGVIVITTKKGKLNQPLKIEFNTNLTLSDKPDLGYLPQMGSADYIGVEKFLFSNKYKFADTLSTRFEPFTPVYEILFKQRRGAISDNDANSLLAEMAKTDIRDEYSRYMYRAGMKQQYAMGLSGGSQQVSWHFAGGYDQNIGYQDSKYDRLNLSFRNTYNPIKSLKLSTALYYTQSKSTGGRLGYDDVRMGIQQLPPYIKFADENGIALPVTRNYRQNFIDTVGNGLLLDWNFYMKDDHNYRQSESSINDITVNFGGTYSILKWLSADVKYQYERQSTSALTLYQKDSYFARNLINQYSQVNRTTGKVTYIVPLGGIRDESSSILSSNSIRGQLTADHNSVRHAIAAILGSEIRDNGTAGNTRNIYGYNPDILTYTNVDFANTYPSIVNGVKSLIPNTTGFSGTTQRFVSAFLNIAYSFDNRYTVSASARRDASNLFGVNTNDKWNLLWSAGAAWNISKEKFYRSGLLPYLKLRATYGFSGNVDLNRSAVTTISFLTSNPFTGLPRGIISQYGNPGLTWERVGMTNVSLEFGSKNNRISGSIDFFRKKATDLFGKVPMDYTTGIPLSGAIRNVASIKGKGLDLELNGLIINSSVKWSANLNYSHYTDEVVDYYTGSFRGRDFLTVSAPNLTGIIGRPLYSFYSYKWQGLDPANGDPIGYINGHNSKNYAAITGDSTSVNDLVYHGSAVPTSYGSLGNTISWKNFSATVRLIYKFGYFYRRSVITYNSLFSNGTGGHPEYTDRWQKPGDELTTNVPSMIYPAVSNRDNLYSNSEITAEKGDHIRLQYIMLSYNLSKADLKSFPFQNAQLYLNINNLGLLWRANREGRDPEYRRSLLPSKSFSLGLKITI